MEKITVKVEIKSDVNKVWNFFTNPQHITVWNQADATWHCPTSTNDLRVGGRFSSTMAAKDGSSSFDFTGVYTKVEDKKIIEYIMDDGRKVSVLFADLGDGTVLVTETFEIENTHTKEQQREGWQAIMNSFKKYVEESR